MVGRQRLPWGVEAWWGARGCPAGLRSGGASEAALRGVEAWWGVRGLVPMIGGASEAWS